MAQTVETEVVETMPSPAIGKHDSSDQEGTERQQLKGNAPSGRRSRWILLFAGAVAVAAVASWWLSARNYESTDDAQIEGHLDLVSPRISGTVSYINPRVENNQFVEAGALLLELDPRDYDAEFEHAKADLDTRSADARSALVAVPIADARSFGGLHSAEDGQTSMPRSTSCSRTKLCLPAPNGIVFDTRRSSRSRRSRVPITMPVKPKPLPPLRP
jgi:membrane fusion protein (multidrug efflux system)